MGFIIACGIDVFMCKEGGLKGFIGWRIGGICGPYFAFVIVLTSLGALVLSLTGGTCSLSKLRLHYELGLCPPKPLEFLHGALSSWPLFKSVYPLSNILPAWPPI